MCRLLGLIAEPLDLGEIQPYVGPLAGGVGRVDQRDRFEDERLSPVGRPRAGQQLGRDCAPGELGGDIVARNGRFGARCDRPCFGKPLLRNGWL